MQNRISIPEYVLKLAEVAKLRSEDPYRQVGAVAVNEDKRVIGVAYNGLQSGFNPPEGFWDDRDERQKYMIHAETNLCSLFERGEAYLVAVTTLPCTSCMQNLISHGVKHIVYKEDYPGSDSHILAKTYDIKLEQIETI